MIEPLKTVMIARPNLFKVPGGDTVQLKETANALRMLGVEVDIHLEGEIDYTKYQLIHFFNVITPEDILGHVYNTTLPYVISTIYVNYREYDKYHRKDIIGKLSQVLSRDAIEYLKTLGKFLLKSEKISTFRFFLKGHNRSIEYILKHAKLLLPNSENEFKRIKADYKITTPYTVVPNAINTSLFKPLSETTRDTILCVARIEGQKNQLNIIRALKNTNYKIIFIGAYAPNQLNYYEQCKAESTSNMTFINFIPQAELLSYYSKAKVHILASWFETTGLSNLEAGMMGCQLVVGDRGDVRDYLGEHAFYCEPGDLNSIKNAVDAAWNAKKNDVLPAKILSTFTWEKAAEATLKAYQTALKV